MEKLEPADSARIQANICLCWREIYSLCCDYVGSDHSEEAKDIFIAGMLRAVSGKSETLDRVIKSPQLRGRVSTLLKNYTSTRKPKLGGGICAHILTLERMS